MTDQIIATYTKPDLTERVLIVKREDGCYSYRRQWSGKVTDHIEWGAAGPYCGIYDSAETAEVEAASRVDWMRVS